MERPRGAGALVHGPSGAVDRQAGSITESTASCNFDKSLNPRCGPDICLLAVFIDFKVQQRHTQFIRQSAGFGMPQVTPDVPPQNKTLNP